MTTPAVRARVVVLTLSACLLGAAMGQAAFDFMPAGGKMLLERALAQCEACAGIAELSAEERSADDWQGHLDDQGALDDFTEAEVATLTHYLASNLPAEGVEQLDDLPRSGREIVIVQCTVCHSIAVPMTEDRTAERWREHIRVPPHDAIGLPDEEWATLSSYLGNNAPLPVDQIPEELRRGAGGY